MRKLSSSYKIGAIGLLAILAITIVPFDGETYSDEGKLYGLLTLVQYDENSNEVFSQSTHNRLVDQGETFLLGATFNEVAGAAPADNTQIGSICIKGGGAIDAGSEVETAVLFESDNTITEPNCIVDVDNVDITSTQGTAVIGPLTFNEPTHIGNGETILGIGICQANGGVTPFTGCDTTGQILFAIVDTADITLASAETVQITYTFDITSIND